MKCKTTTRASQDRRLCLLTAGLDFIQAGIHIYSQRSVCTTDNPLTVYQAYSGHSHLRVNSGKAGGVQAVKLLLRDCKIILSKLVGRAND